jgi:glycosyltransferase involved in cell wall biosynthesis
VDGVHVIRDGEQWTVHLRAIQRYRGRLLGRFDVVIDQINTIPFFTPLWSDIPAFAMIWQLAREVWWYESRFPINVLGFAAESAYLSIYRNAEVFTFSPSTQADLVRLGFHGKVAIVPPGIEPPERFSRPKTKEPTFVYVGRIAPSKRVLEIVEAFGLYRTRTGIGRLVLIGDGPSRYVEKVTQLATRLGIAGLVENAGWLDGASKHCRMAEAHALLMASAREGWGLVVTECNSYGTPAVVYDVPGLRDSVRHRETGLVVCPTPDALAEGMVKITTDHDLYSRLQAGALNWSASFTYENASRMIMEALESALGAPGPGKRRLERT